MRPLGLSDTIMYNLRDGFINAVTVMDGPCDVARLIAQVEDMTAARPGWSERPLRLGVWSFARAPEPIDITRHISVLHDPDATTIHDIGRLQDRFRRNRLETDGPPWRLVILNPGPPGAPKTRPGEPLSAIHMQLRHGLADGMRGFQAMSHLDDFEPAQRHIDLAAGLPETDIARLEETISVLDSGMYVTSISRKGMPRGKDAGLRLAEIVAETVGDAKLFPGAQPLKGTIGRTRMVKRRGTAGGVGNHVKMVALDSGEKSEKQGFRIPGLERAQNLPISQWAVAVSPGPLARLMMRMWHTSFDAIGTLLPLPPRLDLGGRAVTAMFSAPPTWGPIPLVVLAIADRTHYHLTIVPGRGFSGDVAALTNRLTTALNPEAITA